MGYEGGETVIVIYMYYVFHVGYLKEISSSKWTLEIWKLLLFAWKEISITQRCDLSFNCRVMHLWNMKHSRKQRRQWKHWMDQTFSNKKFLLTGHLWEDHGKLPGNWWYRAQFIIIDFEIVAIFPTYFLLCPLDQEDEGIQEDIRLSTHNCLWLWLVCFYCCL